MNLVQKGWWGISEAQYNYIYNISITLVNEKLTFIFFLLRLLAVDLNEILTAMKKLIFIGLPINNCSAITQK